MEAADDTGDVGEDRPFPRRAVFVVPLPDALPVADGAVYSRVFDEEVEGLAELALELRPGEPLAVEDRGHQLVTARLWQVPVPGDVDSVGFGAALRVYAALMGREPDWEGAGRPPIETYRTVAVVSAWAGEAPTRAAREQGVPPDPFTRCVDLLAFLVRGYRMSEGARIPELTYERLPPFVLCCWQDTARGEFFDEGILTLAHDNLRGSFAPEPLDADGTARLYAFLDQLHESSPVLLVNERTLEARIALWREGDYGAAAVQAALACEILLDLLLGLMLWEEQLGTPDIGAAVAAFGRDLTPRVRNEYACRLGGNWSMVGDGALAHWADRVAGLRGRVVHRGYRPTRDEAYAAVEEASVELLDFVKTRLAARVTAYPRTALLVVSEPGLRALGAWQRVERFAIEDAETEPMWIRAYRKWRNSVDAHL